MSTQQQQTPPAGQEPPAAPPTQQPPPTPPQPPAAGQEPPAPPPANDPWADPESARAEIEKLRKESAGYRTQLREVEPLAAKARELEDAAKTNEQRLAEQLQVAKTASESSATDLLRLEVALDAAPAGMDPAAVRRLAPRLQGGTREELLADAAELFAQVGTGASAGDPAAGHGDPGQAPPAAPRVPVENLRPGTLPTQQPTSLPERIATAEAAGEWDLARQLKSQQHYELIQKQQSIQ